MYLRIWLGDYCLTKHEKVSLPSMKSQKVLPWKWSDVWTNFFVEFTNALFAFFSCLQRNSIQRLITIKLCDILCVVHMSHDVGCAWYSRYQVKKLYQYVRYVFFFFFKKLWEKVACYCKAETKRFGLVMVVAGFNWLLY